MSVGTVADLVVETLQQAGVRRIFGVVTATQELSMPPTVAAEQIRGFSFWMPGAVMSGRGDEVIDLARTDLLPRQPNAGLLAMQTTLGHADVILWQIWSRPFSR